VTQPDQPQLPLSATVIPAATPDGQHVAQARIIVGPSCYLLELPGDVMEQLTGELHAAATQAAAAIRRANLGLILPGQAAPNGGGPKTPGQR
jgi:hypothetical protein